MRNTSNSTINHKLASKLVNGIKSSISILLISLGTLLIAAKASQAQQVFPVLANMQVNPPYSPYLSDYTAAGTNKLQLNLFLKDLTKTNYQCRLRLKIEGLGITIQSKNDFPVVPLTLNGGELSTFSGSELASYLNPQNLVFQGIDETEIRRNGGKLPEGLYRFTIEVQDYYRRTVVSNAALAVMPIFLAYPPIINLPLNGSRVTATEPQNVIFQWTPRNAASTSSAYNTAYNVKLVEIIPAGRDANDAIRSSRPIYETYTDRTMLVYGPAEPTLTPGASYALQVQAIEAEGRELFVNNGYSEVVRFTYGERCPTPPSVTLELAGTNAVKVSWAIMPGQQAFSIRYRQAGNPTAQWFEKETYTSSETIDGLRPSTSYEFQVKAQCTYGYGDYSETQTFNMPDEDFSKGDFVCGRADDGALSDQGSPLLLLRPSMIFIAGKFPVKVTTASGGNGVFSGTGTLGVPFLNYLSFKVSFQDIRINTELKMTSGKVVFVRQQLEQSIEEGIKSITVAPDENGNVTAINSNGLPTIIDAAITSWPQAMPVYDAASKTVKFSASVNGGAPKEITLKLVDGQPPLTFQDKNQETFKVDEQGKVTYMGRENPTQFFGSGASTNFTIDTSRGKVAFAPNSGQQYGFDGYDTGLAAKSKTYAADYLPLNDGDDTHRASWKSMESRQFDKVKAILSITDPKLDPKKLAFVTGKGDTLSSTLQNDNTYIISLAGALPGNGSEIYAVYPPDKGAAKGASGTYMGRLNIYSYAKLSKKLVIVPVNGAGTGINATALEGGLNRIYQQAVAEWKVELAGNFKTDAGFDNLDNGNSSSMSAYTEAQKRLAKAYRDAGNRMDDGTYYIFVIKALSNGDAGYMARGGQVGFVSSTDVRTIAHELGHGAYKLQHTWDQYGLAKGSTNNLMDYASGTELWYGQWRYMRNPDVIFRPLEGDDEGAQRSPECDSKLKNLAALIKNQVIPINFLKLLAAEEQENKKSSDGKYIIRTYNETDIKIVFYENAWPNEIDHLFKIELSGQNAKDTGLNSFWLYFNPNSVTTEAILVTLAIKDAMPPPGGEKNYCYLPMENLPRGISAAAAFSDMVAQQVFLTAEILSTGGVLRAGRFATGAAIDLGLQLAMLDIIKTYLGERFNTADLLAEVSWPSVLYSGFSYNKKIPVVASILGSFTVGFADALAKEAFKEKSAKNLNLGRASYEGFKQALITAGVEAVLRLVKIPAKYSRKQVEDAFEDAAKGVKGAGDDLLSFVNKSLTDKLKQVDDIWKTKYPVQEMLEGRTFFEDIMGQYRYAKSSGWSHTGDISEFFKGVDFYKGTTQGANIFAETAVSMKTTITTNVDNWLASAPIQKNIGFLTDGLNPTKGLQSNSKLMFIQNAEIHIYMPKANITEALKTTWMNKLNTVNPKIKFEIKALEDFVN
ncbi:fibronectin type III domain-containing protein [Nubsella zeaxanthinifaciens]|uniref:fibronectin type III domain-containing protein n=1 Tax=Nubsella zeaxanthinifaciens TaxID=392412 RepID=UPI000DE451F2|nr:fibronectin type III domain-containing protein [Nubsella zeaxanthinifaciens]